MTGDPVRAAREALREPPTFRDFTGTDYNTCAYCMQPVERPDHEHSVGCPWLIATRALSRLHTRREWECGCELHSNKRLNVVTCNGHTDRYEQRGPAWDIAGDTPVVAYLVFDAEGRSHETPDAAATAERGTRCTRKDDR